MRNSIVILMVLLALCLSAYSVISTRSWINRPFAGFVVLRNNLVPVVWMPGWQGIKQGIKFGDVVVAVNHSKVSNGDELNRYVASFKPGAPLKYTINRSGAALEVTVPVSVFTLEDYLALFSLLIFFGLCFYMMGVVVYYLKPGSAASWAFLFVSATIGLSLIAAPEYCTNHKNILLLFTLPLVGPSFVVLSLYFPEPHKRRKALIALSLGTALPIVILYVYFFNNIDYFAVIDKIMLVQISMNNALALFLISRAFYASQDQLTRQKAKLVIYGITLTCMGVIPFVIGLLILKKLTFFWFLPISLMFSPLSVGYAILARNLFDVDRFIRRTASYVLVSVFAVFAIFGLMAAVSFGLQDLTGQSSRIAAVVSTLLVVALFRPIQQRVSRAINQAFFREGYEYQQTIKKAGSILASIIDLDQLLQKILDTVVDALKVESGSVLLGEPEKKQFRVMVQRDDPELLPEPAEAVAPGPKLEVISATHPLALYLELSQKPFQLSDLDLAMLSPDDRLQIEGLMKDLKFVLVIPVVYELKLIGVLGLGPKKSGAWYSSEDIELLNTLMVQTSVSIENARKVKELKKMLELEISYRELKKLDELKDEFLAMVSHDLRTPMTGIQGYAYILRKMVKDPEQVKYIDVIIQQGDRLTRLINDLLDVQRYEAGKMALEFSDLYLDQLVHISVDAFMAEAGEKGLKVSRSIPEQKVVVSGQSDRLQQALANLISNAIKFSPENGKIMVKLELISREGREQARVSVMDQGPGIPEELQPRLFEKFQQAHNKTSARQKGSGLGLALARQIIDSHHGEIGVESEPDKGSEFFFLLPVKAKD